MFEDSSHHFPNVRDFGRSKHRRLSPRSLWRRRKRLRLSAIAAACRPGSGAFGKLPANLASLEGQGSVEWSALFRDESMQYIALADSEHLAHLIRWDFPAQD